MEKNRLIEMNIADAIMEKPHGFKIKHWQFYLHPVTLGKMYILQRIVESLEINKEILIANPYLEALRLSQEKRDEVCVLLAYHTMNKKEDVFNNDEVSSRSKLFDKELDTEDIAQLLVIVLNGDNIQEFIKHLGIDRERAEKAKISKIKKDKGNTFTFGGKSVYGTLIDFACERYGWTMDYVVWGISYTNLQMLMADAITSTYLSDEELKRCHIVRDRTFINGDDPNNAKKIREMFND